METVSDVLAALENIAPARFAFADDHIGLQVGDPSASVERVVVSLDPSLAAVRFAVSQRAQMLVSHHPVIWNPLLSVREDEYKGRIVSELVRSGIAFAAAHTNWDCAVGGINDVLAELIGLLDVRSVGSSSDLSPGEQPICRFGRLPVQLTADEFCVHLDASLSTKTLLCAPVGKMIETVVVCGGAASDEARAAHEAGADAFVTGEVPHHTMVEESERGLAIAAAGHYATEDPGAMRLADRLSKEFAVVKFEPDRGYAGRPF